MTGAEGEKAEVGCQIPKASLRPKDVIRHPSSAIRPHPRGPAPMRAVDIIRKKRDGHALSDREIGWMVAGIADGEVADYQWSALLMAIVWRGMTDAETAALTDAMMRSGTVVDLAATPGRKVDKHS